VTKIIIENDKAIGIETINGKIILAKFEVILCAGSIDTPKLLLLSGIGPKKELIKHNIDVKKNIINIGENLQDHCGVSLSYLFCDNFSDRVKFSISSEEKQKAYKEWIKNKNGPLTKHNSSLNLIFVKDKKFYETNEFNNLSSDVKKYISNKNTPDFEIVLNGPNSPTSNFNIFVINMNTQSKGSIKLKSSNPEDSPLIDFSYMSHPYDKCTFIEGIKQSMKFIKTKTLSKYFKEIINEPKSESKEDIWNFIKDNITPVWHANGSVIMGKKDDINACVDSNLCIIGLKNIRVADLSVCPIIPNAHTQSTAYLIAEFASEKIIKKYNLDF
jgi:choline dehydrogenase-like flavoprotein